MAETALDLSKPSSESNVYVRTPSDHGSARSSPVSSIKSEENSEKSLQEMPESIITRRNGSINSDSEQSSSDKTHVHRPFKMYPMDPFTAFNMATPVSPLPSMPSAPGMSSMFDTAVPTFPLTPLTSHLLQRKRRAEGRPDNKECKKSTNPVPEEKKDDSYWERRRKNNEAAKRSRDSRREKEEEIAMRAAFLEQENLKLRAQVAILKNETAKLHYMLYNRL